MQTRSICRSLATLETLESIDAQYKERYFYGWSHLNLVFSSFSVEVGAKVYSQTINVKGNTSITLDMTFLTWLHIYMPFWYLSTTVIQFHFVDTSYGIQALEIYHHLNPFIIDFKMSTFLLAKTCVYSVLVNVLLAIFHSQPLFVFAIAF